jgi:hypothetical protein
MSSMIYVQAEQVSLGDDADTQRFLSALPHPATVRKLLAKGFFGRRWQSVEACDYWLVSDGKTAAYFRICGASAAQIYAIRLRFDALVIRDVDLELSRDMLCDLVKAVTGECERPEGRNVRIKARL